MGCNCWDHCFPFGYSTFLWVSSPCGVVHWNSIIAQTSVANQHCFPVYLPLPSLPLLGEHFFPPITTFFKSSLESIYYSLKVMAGHQEKSIPKEQCRMVTPLQISRGRQSRVLLKGQAKGRCARTAVRVSLIPSVPLSLGPQRWAASTAPSWQHCSQPGITEISCSLPISVAMELSC